MNNLFLPNQISGNVASPPAVDPVVFGRRLLLVVAFLTVFGLTMLYSTSYNVSGVKYFQTQIFWVLIGGAGGAAAFFFGYRRVASLSTLWIVLAVVMLLAAVLFFNPINGAYRWIRFRFGGMVFSIQPSELAKVALTIFTARYCAENLRSFSEWRWKHGLLPLGCVIALVMGGIMLGKDLGTTILVGAVVFCVLMAAGLYIRYFFIPVGGLALVGYFVYLFSPVRMARITSFLEPESYAQTTGYQLYNSLLALGSGSWFGIGFMSSRMKARYLPEAHTDFILAIVGEELGLIAMGLVILGYTLFTWYGIRISLAAGSRLGMLLGFGLTLGITLQAVINLAVIAGAAPTKGMPAPFISYGGSNMIMCLTAVGLLLSIAADASHPGYNDEYLGTLRHYLGKVPFLSKLVH